MDIEQLKLIVNTINGLGANAKEGFIWWVVLDKAPGLLLGSAWTGIFAYAIKKGFDLLKGLTASRKLMEAAGVSICWNNHELVRACAILSKYFKDPKAL